MSSASTKPSTKTLGRIIESKLTYARQQEQRLPLRPSLYFLAHIDIADIIEALWIPIDHTSGAKQVAKLSFKGIEAGGMTSGSATSSFRKLNSQLLRYVHLFRLQIRTLSHRSSHLILLSLIQKQDRETSKDSILLQKAAVCTPI